MINMTYLSRYFVDDSSIIRLALRPASHEYNTSTVVATLTRAMQRKRGRTRLRAAQLMVKQLDDTSPPQINLVRARESVGECAR